VGENARDIKVILSEAMAKDKAEERAAYLNAACGDNAPLRGEIESLLQLEGKVGDFLEAPVLGPNIIRDEPPVAEGPGTIIGRYKLLEKIGEGGMAVVYMAEQEQPIRRKVALKIIKLGMDTRQVIARFEAERQALALMDHPSIAKVLDGGATETGRPYFVMELVTGVSITEYCDRNNLSTKDRLALFVQVCHAVQHAHQKGIIHRDIKPSNVMVTHHDGKPVPKVIDFGIAKATNQKLTEKTLFTRYAHIIGTPAYMSPEQAELSDLDIDTRSDIYSLGVLLYELLTSTTPFSEEELRKAGYIEMQRVIREQEPIKPSTKLSTLGDTLTDIAKHRGCTPDLLHKAVRGDLDWIVMKSLEKDRARRYETASGLAEDIRRHLESEPVLARGPSTTYRLRKFLRRHRVQALAVVATTVVASVVVVILSMWNRDRLHLVEAEGFRHRNILSQAREQYAKAEREAALETIKPILDSRHVGPEAQLLYAGILVDGRQADEATATLERLIDERPAIAGAAHSLLARIFWESESLNVDTLKQIDEHRQQAEALLPETAEAHFLQAMTAITVKDQLAWLDRALELDSRHYASLRLRAFVHRASRRYEQLCDDALGMTILQQDDPLGYSLRAIALRELGKYDAAIRHYDKAIALTPVDSPQSIDLWIQYCETLLRMGDYGRVVKKARECFARWPDRHVFHYHIFYALTALGEYDEAEAVFRQIVGPRKEPDTRFANLCEKHVFDSLRAGRIWHPPGRAPAGRAFVPMIEAEDSYLQLSAKGRWVTTDGFNACWSPDGTKFTFSIGVHGYSGVAIYDPATKETDLLIIPGKDPQWSPDGKYIAFVRDCQVLRVPELVGAVRRNQHRLATEEEVWIMNADGTEPRRLAKGSGPSWGKDSMCVYYHSRLDKAFCAISITDMDTKPQQLFPWSGAPPSVSPDGQCVAYKEAGALKVRDLASQAVIAEWPTPFGTADGPAWSPTGRELCLAGRDDRGEAMGLWIYAFDTNEPLRVLEGQITSASWAPDGTKLAFTLGSPHFDIWVADLDPNVSTLESLGSGQTVAEHWQDMVRLYTHRIVTDPLDAYAYFERARCYDYLHDRAKADADMRRWSAAASGRLPSDPDAPPAQVDFTFGEPVDLDVAMRFFPDASLGVSCFSSDGLEMFVGSNRGGGQGSLDIWVLKRASPEEDWGPPENLGPVVNTAGFEAAGSISDDGLELYFISSRPGGRGGNDMYVTRRTTRTSPWGPPINLGPKVNSPYAEAGLSVSSNGLELYFSSGRGPEGMGGIDLYVSTRATTQDLWGDPVNLGPAVNSPSWEQVPSLSPDGLLLFFASDRPGGYGDYDIWMTRRASHTAPWEPAVNLGPTINSPEVDLGGCLAPDGSTLYFARGWPDSPNKPCKAPIIPIMDFNGEGEVDAADYLRLLLANWGTSNSLYDIGPFAWGDVAVNEKDLKVPVESLVIPGPKASDVPQEVILRWVHPSSVKYCDVYFGESSEAASSANRADTKDVLVSYAETTSTYYPEELLEYNTTYYWRVDFIGAGSAPIIYGGPVLSFMTVAYSYPIKNVIATASSARTGGGPEKTVDGSGLDKDNFHSMDTTQMWLTSARGIGLRGQSNETA